MTVDADAPLIVVTTDCHTGPRLKDDLREYCPKKYLEEYDDFVRAYEPFSDPAGMYKQFGGETSIDDRAGNSGFDLSLAALRTNATAGHHDVYARLEDMNRDGVAAEVIYHGSQNGQCFPFISPTGGTFNALFFSPTGSAHELELAAVGQHMYNRWLADQCSVESERHIGLAHLPMWNVDTAIREVEWAHDAGLRGVNFPGPKHGIKPYDHAEWERFWAVCEERELVLSTHDGAGIDDLSVRGPHTLLATLLEGDLVRKMFPRMIFGGMFERYPKLKFALTELQQATSTWWTQTADRYDALWEANRDALSGQLPRPPSEYMAANIFLGQSLLHALPSEVQIAVRDGYSANIMWGSDYPHQEGVYRHSNDEETRTRLGLRNAFSGAPEPLARDMIGETAIRVYGFDRSKLEAVAQRIGAMTARELAIPLESVPEEWGLIARAQVPFPEYRPSTDSARR